MNRIRMLIPLPILALLAGLLISGYFSRAAWLPWVGHSNSTDSAAPAVAVAPEGKIIVGDQAQKNLKLTAKPLKAGVFWKSITVPGMVVDRPGVSDRDVVAPAIGIVSQVHRVPGETVEVGDVLFTLKLMSDALHTTQSDLFKSSQDIKLAQAKLKQLIAAGEGIARYRLTEVENEIKRLQAAVSSYREQLRHRGLSPSDIDGVAEGRLVSEIPVAVPPLAAGHDRFPLAMASQFESGIERTPEFVFEVEELKVAAGQQVEAGQTLCRLANHQLLAIEGRAFRDEIPLLERSVKEAWPIEVDFQEPAEAQWPPIQQSFTIRHIVNVIDPVTRTFAFHLPLKNQSLNVEGPRGPQHLWRFRPGQKVWLDVRVEKLDNVFVVPTDAVAREGAEAFVFTQNVNTFERKGVHVLFQDRERVVIANDGSLPTYRKKNEVQTVSAIVQTAAAQLNRMAKVGTSGVPKGYHIHADGSLHKNEDEAK